jgi:phage terminase large subunit-like protein
LTTTTKPKTGRTSYSEIAHQYARDVVDGSVVACKWAILACKRHIRDIERSKTDDFPYEFVAAKADRKCGIIELLPHTKGKWAQNRENLKLEPFQCFAVCSLFGWVHKDSGHYRFSEAYLCLPRKNAKSTLAAAIGHVKFAADDEFGAEVYSGATSEKQAWEVFRPARLMAKNTPTFTSHYGVEVHAKSLTLPKNGSRYEPIIGKPGDGASPSCAIVDEYHEHLDDTLYDAMKTGTVARDNALLLVITTAGSDRSGPCYALQVEAQGVLEGKISNENLFVLIYTIDEGDDWTTEAALKKANPNWGVSINIDRIKAIQRDAIQSARKQNTFKTKHLNMWVNAAVGWMNMADWDKCADPTLRIEDFEGEPCWIGLDLASKLDLAAKVRVFRREIAGKPHLYAFGQYYLNEHAVEGHPHYIGWKNQGILTVTEGSSTDFNRIADDLSDDRKRFIVKEIPHDQHNASPLLQFLQARADWDQRIVPIDIVQSRINMSPPMKELEALVANGQFHHDGDPLLGWAIGNVVVKPDANDLIFPRKERDENKIDPAVALIMPVGRALMNEPGFNAEDMLMVYSPTGRQ